MNRYLLKNRGNVVLFLLLTTFSALMGTGFAFVLNFLLDFAEGGDTKRLARFIVVGCIYVLAAVWMEYADAVVKYHMIKNANMELKRDLFSIAMNKSILDFKANSSSYYFNELTTKCDMCSDLYFKNALAVPGIVVSFVSAVAATVYIQPIMFLIMIVMALLTVAVMKNAAKPIEKSASEFAMESPVYVRHLKDYFEGYREIKLYHAEKYVSKKHEFFGSSLEEKRCLNACNMVFAGSCGEAVGLLSTVLVTGIAVLFAVKGRITVGAVFALAQLMGKFVSPIAAFSGIHTQYKSVQPILEEFKETLKQSPYCEQELSKEEFHSIVMENVGFAYEEKQILNHLSAVFEKGKKYVILGESGSGKSTLLSLLLGINKPDTGRVFLRNKNLEEMKVEHPYEYMASMAQSSFLFEDTIRNNIVMGRDYPERDVERVVQECELADLVRKLPQGLDTVLSEAGNNISGGERQRILLARAFIRNADVILLDEFESNLDSVNAEKLEERLIALKGKLIIAITHKLDSSIIRKFDEIIVIKDGTICKKGSYDEVMEWV